MTDAVNSFARLAAINVNEHVERKGGFAYLSWPFAVSQLRLADPTATWEVRRFGGLPFLATEAGFFVEVAVTVAGITLSQIHPVLDGRNRPILAPTASAPAIADGEKTRTSQGNYRPYRHRKSPTRAVPPGTKRAESPPPKLPETSIA